MQQTVEMELEKETKGTVRYKEKGDPTVHIFGTIYVKKNAFKGGKFPKEVQVTIESLQAVDKAEEV